MTDERNDTAHFQPGRYFIADPCYVFGHRWDEFLETSLLMHGNGRAWGFEFDGHEVWVAHTAHGDGLYFDSLDEPNEYGVDAGLLGIFPEALVMKMLGEGGDTQERLETLGHWHDMQDQFHCSRDASGTLSFGRFSIETDA